MNKAKLMDSDHAFIEHAALSGDAEVELSQLALQTSKNATVRYYAELMIKDHTAASKTLKALAAGKEIVIGAAVDAAHKARMDELAKLPNARFDAAWLDQMIADHVKGVALFKQQSEQGQDPDLRAFAAKNLPHLQHHLQLAKESRQKL